MRKSYLQTSGLMQWLDKELKKSDITQERKRTLADVTKHLMTTPPADVRENIHAYWQKSEVRTLADGKGIYLCYCTNCRTVGNGTDDFCGKCGAVMDFKRWYEGD